MMMRALVLLLGLVAGCALVAADVLVQSQHLSFEDHNPRVITLIGKGQKPTEKVIFRVTRGIYSVPGTPNSLRGVGTLEIPGGWIADETLPTSFERVSNVLFTQEGGKYGAAALLQQDIYPLYGDYPGAWVVQSGDDNFVRLQYPSIRSARAIKIYETLNPGGVFRVKIHSIDGESATVFNEGDDNSVRETLPNGASILTITFPAVDFLLTGVTIYVDASKTWRAIDTVRVVGDRLEQATVPGDIFGNQVTLVPFPEKPYGCDAFEFNAHDDEGGPWSPLGTVTVCYGCPKNPKTGQACSGVGKCLNAECLCEKGFSGDACEVSACPRIEGKICGGKGVCNAGFCDCFKEWTGAACERRRNVKGCSACNDPHYTSFDGAVFSFYEIGESLLFQWRNAPGPVLEVAQHLRWCGANAYMKSWSPISCMDGGSVRYGDDIVTFKCTPELGKAPGNFINCRNVPDSNNWVNVGPNGMQVRFSGGMQVRIGDVFYFSADCGCFNLITSIPDTAPNSNEIVGMCGNNDGIRSNDAWGAKEWVDIPSFPTEQMAPIGPVNHDQILRERAIAWGKFFEPTPNCDLYSCKRCGSYLNYNQFPIKYNGQTALAKYEKIAAKQILLESETEAKIRAKHKSKAKDEAKNKSSDPNAAHRVESAPGLVTFMQSLIRARASEDLRTGRVATDGDLLPEGMKVGDLPEHLIGCPYELLYDAMDMKTCLQFLGRTAFDDCIWDACALASKDGGLTPAEAIVKATEINVDKVEKKAELVAESEKMESAQQQDENKAEGKMLRE